MFKLPKAERLKSKKKIEELFSKSSSFFLYPIKMLFRYDDQEDVPHASEKIIFPQILISVPKRNFKRAVDRNRLKRQIKEAYRLHKNLLVGLEKRPTSIAFIYIAKKKESYQLIAESIKTLLQKID